MAGMKQYTLFVLSSIVNFIRHRLPGSSYIWSFFDILSLGFVDIVRLFPAHHAAANLNKCKRPAKPLILYEYEGCPYCRKVRETLTVLDIDHYVYPCPRETLKAHGQCVNSKYRPEVLKKGGSLQFPFLEDPNTGEKLYESDKINSYLWETYGAEAIAPFLYRFANWKPFQTISLKLTTYCRPALDMGFLRAPAHRANKPLELWGFETSPFVRRVRETLTTLELPYLYHVMPHGSTEKRAEFKRKHGSFGPTRDRLGLCKVPFLRDPNNNFELFESSAIVEYLCVSLTFDEIWKLMNFSSAIQVKYQTAPVTPESWLDWGSRENVKKQD